MHKNNLFRAMAKFIIFTSLLVIVAVVIAIEPQNEFRIPKNSTEHFRFRRVTCDLLGFTGHSACAAHCLSMGKAGGTCNNGICICRRDTFEEVLDKEFSETKKKMRDWEERPKEKEQN